MSRLVSTSELLQIAEIVATTQAEGPGLRYAIWFQGCPLRCPGCCNPEMLRFAGGKQIPTAEVIAHIRATTVEHGIEGISLLGGEPIAHAGGAHLIAQCAQELGLSVMIYSGFTLAELQSSQDAHIQDLLAATDVLVDGPYLRDQPESEETDLDYLPRRWIGSRNQQLHLLSDFYQADDPRWRARNTLELRLIDGELQVNGFPAQQAKVFWQRSDRPR
jgi:anaerobic ribonucleoside-triphosphate reductase activating protein